jgi:carbonic anhydrase
LTDSASPSAATFVPNTDELLGNNVLYAAAFDDGDIKVAPRRNLAIVACMDARMNLFEIFGIDHGDAHIIRNAGGVITDDVIRSLCLSQRALGTREIILVHHTDCGLQNVSDDEFKAQLEREIGIKPWWALESFVDPFSDVRQSIRRLEMTPFIVHKDHIRGFVYDVRTGLLDEVEMGDRQRHG